MITHKDIDNQVSILKSHGLIVKNELFAKDILSTINYYRLSGYLFQFRKTDGQYIEGLTFERILNLYTFDSKLTRILMYALENVEESLKTRFSYELSSCFPNDPLIYLGKAIFKDATEHKKFVDIFNKAKKDNSALPFIKHHDSKYNGNLPIWVAVEIMTMGNLFKLYSNLKTEYQKRIAKKYNTGPVQLLSWIENLTYTRNHLAHYMRIYNYNFGRIPASCSNHIAVTQSGKIFDQILAIGFMFSNSSEWKSYVVPEIAKLIADYKPDIELQDIGFPVNWEEILISI